MTSFGLVGCLYSYPIKVGEGTKYEGSTPISASWLRDHREEVVKRTVEYVRKEHPSTADWFPQLTFGNVRLQMSESKWIKNELIEAELLALFKGTSAQLLPLKNNRAPWVMDVDARFARPETNPALYAVVIPYGLLCWSNFLIVCPMKVSEYVVLDAKIKTDRGEQFDVRAVGGSTIVMSTPWAQDNDAWMNEGTSKAIAAAIADFANKLVTEVERRRPNISLQPTGYAGG